MRLNRWIYVLGLVGGFAGCSTLEFAGMGSYANPLYDTQGQAPASIAAPQESEMTDVHDQSKADYHFTLAETYSLEGKWSRAVENYKTTLIYDPRSYVSYYRMATEFVKGGLISQAMENCEKALEINPGHNESLLLKSSLYSVLGQQDKAREGYRALLQRDPLNKEAALLIGASYADENRHKDAVEYFEGLAKQHSSEPSVWYYLGRTYLQLSPPQKRNAESALRTSLRLQPAFEPAVMELAQVYASQKKYQRQIDLLSTYQNSFGRQGRVAESLSDAYLSVENYDKALEQLEIVAAQDESNLNIPLKMAFILVDQKRFSEAIPILKGILAKSPDSDRVRFYLGAVYEELNSYKSALAEFSYIQRDSDYYAESVMHRAYLMSLTGQAPQGLALLERHIRETESEAKVYALYGSLLDNEQQFEKARGVLEAGIVKYPRDTQLRYQLGSIFDRLGRRDKTVEQMELLLELDKDHVEGLNYLAFVYAEGTENLGTAEDLARRAMELQPNDGFIMDTLGWVLFKQNRLQEAVRLLETAHGIEKAESIIAEHLGDAYFRIQLHNKAKNMYKIAIENENDASKKAAIQTKLETINQRLQSEQKLRTQRVPASR